jgi:crotonobetainyl-CoA:carnitine CoA-transferase CaiB-like acyl-CoA transferase
VTRHDRGVPTPPLAGLRVIDAATIIAGPGCARYLADFGADVIKVEHPDGDSVRRMGFIADDGESLYAKLVNRGKRTIALDLKQPDDLDIMRKLCASADVLVENFRPGTLERLGLAPADLLAANPTLVITRITGFGQDGPYAHRPGFATIAEAMSGFAAINGEPDGEPLLPPIALTDEVTAIAAAFATMVALRSGVGQVVDVSLLESLFQIMGPLISAYEVLAYQQPRMGSGIPYSVPRGTFRTRDGKWVAISASAESVARRVMQLIGFGDDARFGTFTGRIEHRDEVHDAIAKWIGERDEVEVLRAFEDAHAAAAPVLDMAAISVDAHYRARGAIADVDGVPMQGLVARLSATPGAIRHIAHPVDADRDEIIAELG